MDTLSIGDLVFVNGKGAIKNHSDNPPAGYFQRRKNGTMFFLNGTEDEGLWLVEPPGQSPFFVSAYKHEGQWRFMFSTSSLTERDFHLPKGYREKMELAASLARPKEPLPLMTEAD